MANEFFVRKGLAIATSSVATASGASQSTKYLVIGEDNIVRWASASSAVSATPSFQQVTDVNNITTHQVISRSGFDTTPIGALDTISYIGAMSISGGGGTTYKGLIVLKENGDGSGNDVFLTTESLSANRSISLPDKNGIIALTTDIPVIASPAFSFQINNGNSTAGLTSFGVAQFSSNSLHFNNSSIYLSGTSSVNNTLIGFGAGRSMTTGSSNTFMGASAGFAKTTGLRNTYIGDSAGSSNMIGSNNVFIGSSTGLRSGTGSNNTFIGAFVGTASIEYNNTIAIGSYASPTADNQLVIASSEYPIGTASSAVFSHFLNTKINGIDVKIPIYL